MNSLHRLDQVLKQALNAKADQPWPEEIFLSDELVARARLPLDRMLEFRAQQA
jgi:quinolinate synthase